MMMTTESLNLFKYTEIQPRNELEFWMDEATCKLCLWGKNERDQELKVKNLLLNRTEKGTWRNY